MRRSLEERFWSYTEKADDGCWQWHGPHDGRPRARIKVFGKYRWASRISWELRHGAIPDGLCVLHKCDNPMCVNPGHLFLGTQLENIKDRHGKGRTWSKLSDIQVRAIRILREEGLSGNYLAKTFGVSPATISMVVHRQKRVHV